MSDMIERVARALAKEEGYAYDPLPYDRRARAAIEAMREPGYEVLAACDIPVGGDYWSPKECWQAMIDAALNEKSPATVRQPG